MHIQQIKTDIIVNASFGTVHSSHAEPSISGGWQLFWFFCWNISISRVVHFFTWTVTYISKAFTKPRCMVWFHFSISNMWLILVLNLIFFHFPFNLSDIGIKLTQILNKTYKIKCLYQSEHLENKVTCSLSTHEIIIVWNEIFKLSFGIVFP